MLEKSQKKSHSLEARVRNAERHQEALQQDDSVAAMMREVRERNAQITQLHTKHKEVSGLTSAHHLKLEKILKDFAV